MFSVSAVLSATPGRLVRARRGRGGRRSLAMLASLALHGGLIAMFIAGAAGGVVTGGGGGTPEASAITVSLAGIAGSKQATHQTEQSRLEILYQNALTQQSDLYASEKPQAERSSLNELFDNIERDHGGDANKQGTNGKGDSGDDTGAGRHGSGPVSAQADATAGPGAAASSGTLWGQISPCWRRMPNASAVPVRLRVRLNDRGQIDKPPIIVRPDGATPGQARLIAEARAIAAISACVPYTPADGIGAAEYVVDFGVSGRGR